MYSRCDLRPEQVKPPLGMFQATRAVKDDTRRLIGTVNRALGGSLPDDRLNTLFERMWPELEIKLSAIPPTSGAVVPEPSDKELLAEILTLTRAGAQGRKEIEWLDRYAPTMKILLDVIEANIGPILAAAQAAGQPPASAAGRVIYRPKTQLQTMGELLGANSDDKAALGAMGVGEVEPLPAGSDEQR